MAEKAAAEWIGCFYPLELVQSSRSRALFALLFDRLVCHFPIAHSGCGGGAGVTSFFDDPLVEHGVIELREEYLHDVPFDFTEGAWGTPDEFDEFTRLQVTAMALEACRNEGAVPVTDDPTAGVPANLVVVENARLSAKLQAGMLALSAIGLALPSIAEGLHDDEILEAREKLADQLIPFRAAMLRLAPVVRGRLQEGCTLEHVRQEASYAVETAVLPPLMELRRRLELERGRFWRRLLMQAGPGVPSFVLSWATGGAITAAISAVRTGAGVATELIDREAAIETLVDAGGVGFLLALPEVLEHAHETRLGQLSLLPDEARPGLLVQRPPGVWRL